MPIPIRPNHPEYVARRRREITHVTINGDGSAIREFTHVLDAAAAVRLALEFIEVGEHRTFNVGTGRGVSVAT
jgi:UDP-glucose 4-epimerase